MKIRNRTKVVVGSSKKDYAAELSKAVTLLMRQLVEYGNNVDFFLNVVAAAVSIDILKCLDCEIMECYCKGYKLKQLLRTNNLEAFLSVACICNLNFHASVTKMETTCKKNIISVT